MYDHEKRIIKAGTPQGQADSALIMLHGRGASAASFISLEKQFNLVQTTIVAPQATNNSWYPYSFLAPLNDNQPALDSALALIKDLVADLVLVRIPSERISFLGFSQGACLTLEYVARNPARYHAVVAFTGGLIGSELDVSNYKGDFLNTPVLITTGDPDMHVPLPRVQESVEVLTGLGADVSLRVYKGRPHTITSEELELAKELLNLP